LESGSHYTVRILGCTSMKKLTFRFCLEQEVKDLSQRCKGGKGKKTLLLDHNPGQSYFPA